MLYVHNVVSKLVKSIINATTHDYVYRIDIIILIIRKSVVWEVDYNRGYNE